MKSAAGTTCAGVLLAGVLLAGLVGASAAGVAAVRTCGEVVTSGPQSAASIAEAQKLAIAAWAKRADVANGARFTSWRLAFNKSMICKPAEASGVVCEAKAAPCVIEQAPQRPPRAPEPKIIPVPPATVPLTPRAIGT